MILYIDTTNGKEIFLKLFKGEELLFEKSLPAERRQAEELLPGIEAILTENKLKLSNLTEIKVNNVGGSFTSLRIGVVTANALAYALDIPISGLSENDLKTENNLSIVVPRYSQEPEITPKKKKLF